MENEEIVTRLVDGNIISSSELGAPLPEEDADVDNTQSQELRMALRFAYTEFDSHTERFSLLEEERKAARSLVRQLVENALSQSQTSVGHIRSLIDSHAVSIVSALRALVRA